MEILTMESHKKSFLLLVFAILAVVTCSAFTASGKEAKHPVEKLRQVSLFKNGLGFFTSELTCPEKKNTFGFIPSMAASHGTFWVAYPPKVQIESLVTKEVEVEEQKDAIYIKELLKANLNKKVELSLYSTEGGETTISGVLTYVAEDRLGQQSNPYGPGAWGYSYSGERSYPYGYYYGGSYGGQPTSGATMTSSLVMLKTDAGEVAVDSLQIKKVQFPDGGAEKTITTKRKSMQLDVRLKKPASGEKITVSYLAKGITWAPSYIVDIANDNQARISAKAVVINEACDLNDVTVQLITGFPHLQFSDVFSPLFLKENLSQFLQSLVRTENQWRWGAQVSSNVMRQSARFEGESSGIMPAYSTAEEGKTAEDLFLYPVEHVKLAKKEVGYLPLFTESVPYKHIYTWDIPDYVDKEDRYYYRQDNREEEEKPEEVWHCLRLENTAEVPWTTAPAEVIKEDVILGQDTLFYTPPKGKTTLKVTQAVSIKAEQAEFETDRRRNAAQFHGTSYDLVTINGKLSVTNFKPERATLEITKTFSGEVKQSQPEAKVETLAKGLKRVNPNKKLTWTIDLEAGGSAKLEYTYEVYVH
jgi:hypothetical protein